MCKIKYTFSKGLSLQQVDILNNLIKSKIWYQNYQNTEKPSYIIDIKNEESHQKYDTIMVLNSNSIDYNCEISVFQTKVRQYHLLLSSFYADNLIDFINLTKYFWNLCMDDVSNKNIFMTTFTGANTYLIRMLNTLNYFSEILNPDASSSEDNLLKNPVHNAIMSLKGIVKCQSHDNDCINSQLNQALKDTMNFFKVHNPNDTKYCVSYLKQLYDSSYDNNSKLLSDKINLIKYLFELKVQQNEMFIEQFCF
ncbi:uncharacterized protein LOC126907148 [Daktulosphaira vitifoliae]|uniref:uncharacterized protein LOC126907148 n=1 Tax=Daktulosphaira vitifoliae TaxID=58002 RepID=UPI0021AAD9D9|nr:uncharacterized protein LOC126907148 [Daktulosphaira vitifoliae]